MTETTPQQRAEWAALTEAATPGPWITHEMGRVFVGNQSDGRTSGLWEIVHMSGDDLSDLTPESAERHRQDAAFIAAAREAVPALLADLEAAERERDLAEQQANNHAEDAIVLERERDAYRKAKQENDERFQLEAAAQRERAEQAEDDLRRFHLAHGPALYEQAMDAMLARAEQAEAERDRLRAGIEAAVTSLRKWNGDDHSLVVAANIRHLAALLAEGGSDV